MTNTASAGSSTPAPIAVVMAEPGPADALTLEQAELAPLGPQDVRVSTRYAGVNFWDVMQRRGVVPLPPDGVPGVEGMGVVEAVGSEVDSALVGSRVAWSRVPSSYASQVQAHRDSFIEVPDAVSDEMAAAILMQGVTAQYLAESTTDLGPGQFALVTAAAGGVGSLLTQFLRARGVTVIGVVGSATKAEAAERAGALPLVDGAGLVSEVHSIAPSGVHAVFDATGSKVDDLIDTIARRGICVLYGNASGSLSTIDPGRLADGSRYLTRTAGRDYAVTSAEWHERASDVLARAAAGSLGPVAIEALPLASAAEAHRRLESRKTVGKVLLSTQ